MDTDLSLAQRIFPSDFSSDARWSRRRYGDHSGRCLRLLGGLATQAGLYACLLPMLIYACLGSVETGGWFVWRAIIGRRRHCRTCARLRQCTSGDLERALLASRHDIARLELLNGWLVNLLSHSVITGFVNAAALLIIVSLPPRLQESALTKPVVPFAISVLLQSMVRRTPRHSPGAAALVFLLYSKSFCSDYSTLGMRGEDQPRQNRTAVDCIWACWWSQH